jgi:MFS family permease
MRTDAAAPATGSRPNLAVVLGATSIAAFMVAFMGSALNIALPTVSAELGLTAVMLGWVPTSYTLAAAMLLLPFGRLADIRGRKRIFLVGLLLSAVSYLAVLLVHSGPGLIAVRVVQGAAAATGFATSTAILTASFPPSRRGRVLGINVACVYTGLSVGPFVGGLMTQNLGWRSIFVAGAALALVGAGLAAMLDGEPGDARGQRFDVPGALIYGTALAAAMFGLSRLPRAGGAALIAAGLLGLAGFIAWERRAATPLLDLTLWRNRVFALSNVAALINYSATTAVAFLLSLYLQYIKGLPPQAAGLVLLAQPVMQALLSPGAGWLSERREPRVVASAGMTLTAVGLALLVFLGWETPLAYILGALATLGIGFALFSSPNTNAVMGSVERRQYGIASATVGTMRLTGQMLSLGFATLLFALFIGPVKITQDAYPEFLMAMRVGFAVFAGLCVLGVFASLARGKAH